MDRAGHVQRGLEYLNGLDVSVVLQLHPAITLGLNFERSLQEITGAQEDRGIAGKVQTVPWKGYLWSATACEAQF